MLEVPTDAISGSKLESLLSLMQYSNGTKTDNKTAEKFSAYALNTIPGEAKSEEVVLYRTVSILRQIWEMAYIYRRHMQISIK